MRNKYIKNNVVCVLGMHRSGTSMVMRLLNICGVYVGDQTGLLDASSGNRKGHWESLEVLSINNEILERLGGTWDSPPIFKRNWEKDSGFNDLKERARNWSINMNTKSKIWGFKEPRVCLTIPFWEEILPDMNFIIPVRDSMSVARSLNKRSRGRFSILNGVDIWSKYWLGILENTNNKKRHFTFFDNYFNDWRIELDDVLNFLSLNGITYEGKEEEIDKFISPSLISFNSNKIYYFRNISKDKEEHVKDFILKELASSITSIKELAEIESQKEVEFMKRSKFWKMRDSWIFSKGFFMKFFKIIISGKVFKEFFRVFKKVKRIAKNKGPKSLWSGFLNYVSSDNTPGSRFNEFESQKKDFLFISGCRLKMPHKYRCEFQKEQLEKYGLNGDVIFFDKVSDDLIGKYQFFILYRVPITRKIKNFINKSKSQDKAVVFDIDDLVFEEELTKEKHEVREMSEKQRNKYFDGIRRHRETMKLCDYGIASTDKIAEYMKKYIKDVIVNRNSASDDLIKRSERALNTERMLELKNKIVLGYFSGGKTHDDDLKLIENVLINIFNKYPKTVLFLVGPLNLSQKIAEYNNRIVRHDLVEYDKLPELISQVDINLAPLVLNEFNEGKSELKFTEAGLLKKPTIASRTKPFEIAIEDGGNGFLCSDDIEWIDKLSKLIKDDELRFKLGSNAYESAKENYNTKKIGGKLHSFFKVQFLK